VRNAGGDAMNDVYAPAQAIADALLWEGYVLYPYRSNAAKNQLRWQFGVLMPPHYAAADGFERAHINAECIVAAEPGIRISARVRFLQTEHRQVEVMDGVEFVKVAEADVNGEHVITWDEAVAHAVDINGTASTPFAVPADHRAEYLDANTRVVRTRQEVRGAVRVETTPLDHGLVRVRVAVENTSDWGAAGAARTEALGYALVATHVLLHVEHGVFVSSLDPPDHAQAHVQACTNDGVFPVLVGDAERPSLMLASPVILYDFPAVAPRSPGAMFDGTEIDEVLALRVLTLTPDEKSWARDTDPLARALVDRVETLTPEAFASLHADMLGPSLRVGSRVRLRPGAAVGRRTDAQDLLLAGMLATVKGLVEDLEGERYVAVVVDGDADFGRYRYFYPDEVEPI
jgi:hypothetical protein